MSFRICSICFFNTQFISQTNRITRAIRHLSHPIILFPSSFYAFLNLATLSLSGQPVMVHWVHQQLSLSLSLGFSSSFGNIFHEQPIIVFRFNAKWPIVTGLILLLFLLRPPISSASIRFDVTSSSFLLNLLVSLVYSFISANDLPVHNITRTICFASQMRHRQRIELERRAGMRDRDIKSKQELRWINDVWSCRGSILFRWFDVAVLQLLFRLARFIHTILAELQSISFPLLLVPPPTFFLIIAHRFT